MLRDSDLERLESLLQDCDSEETMDLEMLDGFFVACVVGPEVISPDEYLPVVLGGELAETRLPPQQLQELVSLLFAHWDGVVNAFAEFGRHTPLLLIDADGLHTGSNWCLGFLAGTQLRDKVWMHELKDETLSMFMTPILALAADGIAAQEQFFDALDEAHELSGAGLSNAPLKASEPITYTTDDELDELEDIEPMTDAERVLMVDSLALAVGGLHQHFRQLAVAPRLLTQTKVGRNQPCPCGSGKKWKRCCASPSRQVH